MQRWKSRLGVEGPRRRVAPRKGAQAGRLPEHVKRTSRPVLQLKAFAGRDTGKKGGEDG